MSIQEKKEKKASSARDLDIPLGTLFLCCARRLFTERFSNAYAFHDLNEYVCVRVASVTQCVKRKYYLQGYNVSTIIVRWSKHILFDLSTDYLQFLCKLSLSSWWDNYCNYDREVTDFVWWVVILSFTTFFDLFNS